MCKSRVVHPENEIPSQYTLFFSCFLHLTIKPIFFFFKTKQVTYYFPITILLKSREREREREWKHVLFHLSGVGIFFHPKLSNRQ